MALVAIVTLYMVSGCVKNEMIKIGSKIDAENVGTIIFEANIPREYAELFRDRTTEGLTKKGLPDSANIKTIYRLSEYTGGDITLTTAVFDKKKNKLGEASTIAETGGDVHSNRTKATIVDMSEYAASFVAKISILSKRNTKVRQAEAKAEEAIKKTESAPVKKMSSKSSVNTSSGRYILPSAKDKKDSKPLGLPAL